MTHLIPIATLAAVSALGSGPQHKHEPPTQPTEPPAQQHQHQMPPEQQHEGHQMPMHEMKSTQGDWSMSRQGSGTSWMPDSSPMFMKMLPDWNGFQMHLMGTASANYSDAGGPRGDEDFYSNSMAMLMLRKEQPDGGILGFQFMASLDPVFNGKIGYPNLFQTGETANGLPLRDRQHPHDLISELAGVYSHPIGDETRAILYAGLAGEPALGGSMFMMRPSGMEIPISPISHHWFDSTHISFGVVTLGVAVEDTWKFEGSAFNGTEPDENRYDLDPFTLDSYSGRVSYNPTADWSFQVSYGYLKEPEPVTEPGVSQHRLTASVMNSRQMSNGDNLSTALFFGQNIFPGDELTNAIGLEATYYGRDTAYYSRLERVEKAELVGVPEGTYTVNKLTLGAVHNFAQNDGFDFGVGGFVSLYAFPSSLEPFYGETPVSFGVFVRVRPSRMLHDMGGMGQ